MSAIPQSFHAIATALHRDTALYRDTALLETSTVPEAHAVHTNCDVFHACSYMFLYLYKACIGGPRATTRTNNGTSSSSTEASGSKMTLRCERGASVHVELRSVHSSTAVSGKTTKNYTSSN